MKFPIQADEYMLEEDASNKLSLELQIWDRDVLSGNDFLSSVSIDINRLARTAARTQQRHFLLSGDGQIVSSKSKDNKLRLKCFPNKVYTSGKMSSPSYIKVTVELLTEKE